MPRLLVAAPDVHSRPQHRQTGPLSGELAPARTTDRMGIDLIRDDVNEPMFEF